MSISILKGEMEDMMLKVKKAWIGKLVRFDDIKIGERFVLMLDGNKNKFDEDDIPILYEKTSKSEAKPIFVYGDKNDTFPEYVTNIDSWSGAIPERTILMRQSVKGYMFDTLDGTWEFAEKLRDIPHGVEYFEINEFSKLRGYAYE